MSLKSFPGPRTAEWAALRAHAQRLAAQPVSELVTGDAQRYEHFSREGAGLLMDFSRQRLDQSALGSLLALADAVDLRARIEAMFNGEVINPTEGRAVLHVALRQPAGAAVGGAGIEKLVLAERARMLDFAVECAAARSAVAGASASRSS